MKRYFKISGLFLTAILFASATLADEAILTSEVLNTSLKKMQRIQLEIEDADSTEKPDLLFQLGLEADTLAYLLTNEAVVNNMSQKGLFELAMVRTEEMDVYLDWLPGKKRFIYDGDAFRQYLEMQPQGDNAGESAFRLLEQDFFRSSGNDISSLLESSARKQKFLQEYPDHARAPKAGILLAIDYRDLWRLYQGDEDNENARQFGDKTRNQFQWIVDTFPESEEADIAKGLLQRFESEQQLAQENQG